MEWFSAFYRIASIAAAGTLLGWVLGDAVIGLAATCLLILFFWSLQLWRVEKWLRDSTAPAPDVHGIWGEIVARIYKQQRRATASEERLQSNVDYLLESFAAMRDGVVIVETDGGIRWCNEAAQVLLTLRYPDDVGQAMTNLVREPELSDYLNAGNYAEPLVFSMAGNVPRHLQVVVTQFAEDDILLFVRDVTDRVRTEQMRRDFVDNVSHELRTPLTVITGYLGNLLANPAELSPAYLRAMEQMQAQASRMETLLKDLLWLSRIETTEGQIKEERVDMASLIGELQQDVASAYPGRELVLDLRSRDKVTGDYRELYSAVSNLVFNALKYSDESSPVEIVWQRREGAAELSVCDSGIGIDTAHIPRLTERFYRVDESRSSTTGGTGLGLAIVKHVAAAHGAELKIDSALGQGSMFTLLFPLTAEQKNEGEATHVEAG